MALLLLMAVAAVAIRLVPVTAHADSSYTVYVGYADNHYPPDAGQFPSPWGGDASVVLVGTAGECDPVDHPGVQCPDGAAVRIHANGVPLSGVYVTVSVGDTTWDLWGAQDIPADWDLIIAETVYENFDLSDLAPGQPPRGVCDPGSANPNIPVVHVTIDGTTTDYPDPAQVLITGGVDTRVCRDGQVVPEQSESIPWVQIS